MDATTARLVDFALSTKFATLSQTNIDAAKRSLADVFACALGGFYSPLAIAVRRAAKRQNGSIPAASVWGCAWTTSAEMAAFANGTMLRQLDFSDAYRTKSGGHPSDVIAAILAAGEAEAVSGEATLVATVVAYEIYCSCCDAIDLNTLGWDQPVYCVVASALGAGLLFGLDRSQLANALGIALSSNMALMQTRRGDISNWKNCAGANAAKQGVFAALLARDGISGPSAVIEGKFGLFDIVGSFNWTLPTQSKEFAINRVNLKSFPLCYHGQSAVQAALNLHFQVNTNEIEGIEIEVYAQSHREMANEESKWKPNTPETADHSLPYVVAAALVDGKIDANTFDPVRLTDPRLIKLMEKIRVSIAPDLSARYPKSAPARIVVHLSGGLVARTEVQSPQGHADNPMDATALRKKFLSLSLPVCNVLVAEQFLDAINSFESVIDIRSVVALLSGVENSNHLNVI